MIKTVRLKRRETVFVCGKCLKRHDESKAIRRALKAASKDADVKLCRTTCLGICPKQAVVIASGASLSQRKAIILGDHRDAEDALAALAH